MKKLCFILFIYLLKIPMDAQNWLPLDSGLNFEVRSLYANSTNLYAGIGTSNYNPIRSWDAAVWDTLDNGCGSTPALSITEYQGQLIVAGGCGIMKWNGLIWQPLGGGSNGVVWGLCVDNNELYAVGGFDSIGGIPASNVAKWDGLNWSAIDTTKWYSGIAHCVIVYNGDLYIGGSMRNYNASIEHLAKWDGSQWSAVGNNEMGSSFGGINCFEIYNNELWVAGLFNLSPGCGIARWNGTQWLDAGGAVNSPAQIFDMQVFNGNLYVGGNFSTIAGLPMQFISKWDGTDWCGSGSVFDNVVEALTVYNGELYAGGAFTIIDGDTVDHIAKWIGGNFSTNCGNTTGIKEQTQNFSINVFPNPATTHTTFQIEGLEGNKTLIIYDELGKEIWKKETTENQIELSTENFSAGLYFYRVEQKEEMKANGKIIIE